MQLRDTSPETKQRSKRTVPAAVMLLSKKKPGLFSNYNLAEGSKMSVPSDGEADESYV
jgi:hypothetical protein